MPYASKAQQGFFHSPKGMKKIGAKKVKEFDKATTKKQYSLLPSKVKSTKKPGMFRV